MSILAKYREHIIGVCFLIILFIPHTNTLFYLSQIFVTVLLYVFSDRRMHSLESKIVIFCFSISFVLYILSDNDISIKAILGFLNLLLLFMIFPIADIKISNRYLFFAICFVLLSQLCTVFNIPIVNDFFINAYPISEENINALYAQENATMDAIDSFRLSGLWRSPNNSAREVCFIYAFFILNNLRVFSNKSIIFSILCVTSILLTGSRSGLFVSCCLMVYYYVSCQYRSRNTKITSILIIAVALIVSFVFSLDLNFRGFKLVEGFDNSAGPKIETLIGYIQHAESSDLLFGQFDNDLFIAQAGNIRILDSEYGYLIFQYGFVGLLAYIMFIGICFAKTEKKYKGLYIVLLWVMSNSILCAFRSSLVLMLLLSSIVLRSKNNLDYADIATNKFDR